MKLLETGGYKYAAILHDSDLWEDGDDGIGEHEPGTVSVLP